MKASNTSLARINRQIDRLYPSLGAKLDAKEYSAAVSAANQALAGKQGFNAILYPTNMHGKVGVNLHTGKVFSGSKLIRELNNMKQNTWVEFEGAIKKAGQGSEDEQSTSQSGPSIKPKGEDEPVRTCATEGWEQIPEWMTKTPHPLPRYNVPLASAPAGHEEHWLSARHDRQG